MKSDRVARAGSKAQGFTLSAKTESRAFPVCFADDGAIAPSCLEEAVPQLMLLRKRRTLFVPQSSIVEASQMLIPRPLEGIAFTGVKSIFTSVVFC